jgi:putative redox protein
MQTAKVVYQGELRVLSTHVRSEQQILTDAPPDNNGKGEAFSPTDLLATSLITCMITMMGIAAEKNDWEMGEVVGEVEKIMASAPRRVAGINIFLLFRNHDLSETEKSFLEQTALNCPVAKSIHPDIATHVKFSYE